MFLRQTSAILRAPEGDPAGGDGDGGSPIFSEDQLKAIGQVVNQATTAQLKRMLGPAIGDGLKGVNWGELLAPEFAKLTPAAPSGDDPAKGGKGGKPGETDLDKRIQQLATELETEKKARGEADKLRLKAEQDRRVDAARMKLRSALADKVAPGAVEHAVDRLTLVQNRLTVDENGNPTVRVRRPEYKGGPEVDTDLSIEDALPVLLAEEDMKIYLPAPKGGGNNNPGPRGNGQLPVYATPAQTDEEKARRAFEKEQALAARFNLT